MCEDYYWERKAMELIGLLRARCSDCARFTNRDMHGYHHIRSAVAWRAHGGMKLSSQEFKKYYPNGLQFKCKLTDEEYYALQSA